MVDGYAFHVRSQEIQESFVGTVRNQTPKFAWFVLHNDDSFGLLAFVVLVEVTSQICGEIAL